MALTVETGAGLTNADSYISVADADAYHAARGNTDWDALDSTDDKEPALRRATDFLTAEYRNRWQGARMTATQALDWPRSGVYVDGYLLDDDALPTDIANACAELALRSSANDLSPDVERLQESVKVGPIEVKYAAGSSAATLFRAVQNRLAPYLKGSGMLTSLVRT